MIASLSLRILTLGSQDLGFSEILSACLPFGGQSLTEDVAQEFGTRAGELRSAGAQWEPLDSLPGLLPCILAAALTIPWDPPGATGIRAVEGSEHGWRVLPWAGSS